MHPVPSVLFVIPHTPVGQLALLQKSVVLQVPHSAPPVPQLELSGVVSQAVPFQHPVQQLPL